MPYSVFTDRAIPYHLDGSVVKIISPTTGVVYSFSSADMAEINDTDFIPITVSSPSASNYILVFFPELRDITGIYALLYKDHAISPGYKMIDLLQGSVDSTNGLDGTWTNATMPGGYPPRTLDLDNWRKNIKQITGLSGVKAIRFQCELDVVRDFSKVSVLHLYGHKTAGQTPKDILFLDAENADAEFAIPLDFGDRPAGTSAIRQIKVKNVDPALTASTLVVEVVDPVDNTRVSDSAAGPWVTSKTFASLAPNTASSIIYVKCETAAPPTPLGPMRAPIKATVGAWT